MIYYVSTTGSDAALGTQDAPFKTINRAASIALPGDTVRVHGGVYRECVNPKNSGLNNSERIVYEAVEGEHPVVKGSEIVDNWERVEGGVWRATVDNEIFGDYNPFSISIFGDWFVEPKDRPVHLGDVYLNGKSMYEAYDLESLYKAEIRYKGESHEKHELFYPEYIRYPEDTVYQWYAEVGDKATVLYCNFHSYNPNEETIEINVRHACFYPSRTGVNYITVRGFEIAHAATQWAPPTANQTGAIGPNWSLGWIIENNDIHDSKCSGISIGKEASTGDNNFSKFSRKSGYQSQQEAVFLACKYGWSKDKIGSHVIRNNVIHDCGQCGIVGHLGCIFSRIEHNLIYNVNKKQEFWGHEVAGIKLHAAIDTVIENNNINNCNLGLWLDWQAQGARVTRNVFYDNDRDFFIEVTHGPATVDNNLFLSRMFVQNAAQGTAYIHNLICGEMFAYNVLNRATPYHYPHSTDVAGYAFVYQGDERVMNNIVIGKEKCNCDYNLEYLGSALDKFTPPEEYMPLIREKNKAKRDLMAFFAIPQPVWVEENAYTGLAKPYRKEIKPIDATGADFSISETEGKWVLTLNVPKSVATADITQVTAKRLGSPRITEGAYENPDGTPVDFTLDLVGCHRGERIIPGPIASLSEGVNEITVWEI